MTPLEQALDHLARRQPLPSALAHLLLDTTRQLCGLDGHTPCSSLRGFSEPIREEASSALLTRWISGAFPEPQERPRGRGYLICALRNACLSELRKGHRTTALDDDHPSEEVPPQLDFTSADLDAVLDVFVHTLQADMARHNIPQTRYRAGILQALDQRIAVQRGQITLKALAQQKAGPGADARALKTAYDAIQKTHYRALNLLDDLGRALLDAGDAAAQERGELYLRIAELRRG